jgi:hypothetical protein
MPHVRAIFIDTAPNRAFIKKRKTAIRQIVSEVTGYPLNKVAFIPEPIRIDVMDLAENLPGIEIVPEVGARVKNEKQAEACAKKIERLILERCLGACDTDFNVWLRGYPINGFAEHKSK